jgi:hypothetical protein
MNPGPILIIRNTFPTILFTLLFSASFYSENTKNIFTFLHTHTKPKSTFPASYLLYCIVIYLLHLIFILLTFTPCAWQPLGGVGDTRQGNCFVGCLKKNDESFFNYSPRILYKYRVSSWGKFTLATTLCTWSPNELAPLLSVINPLPVISWQTWCVVQYIVFPWSIVSMSKF